MTEKRESFDLLGIPIQVDTTGELEKGIKFALCDPLTGHGVAVTDAGAIIPYTLPSRRLKIYEGKGKTE